jgi:hypothetical protein
VTRLAELFLQGPLKTGPLLHILGNCVDQEVIFASSSQLMGALACQRRFLRVHGSSNEEHEYTYKAAQDTSGVSTEIHPVFSPRLHE